MAVIFKQLCQVCIFWRSNRKHEKSCPLRSVSPLSSGHCFRAEYSGGRCIRRLLVPRLSSAVERGANLPAAAETQRLGLFRLGILVSSPLSGGEFQRPLA